MNLMNRLMEYENSLEARIQGNSSFRIQLMVTVQFLTNGCNKF